MTTTTTTDRDLLDEHTEAGPRPTSEQVWHVIEKRSFLILGFETPAGDPRSNGVMYEAHDRKLYVAVAPDGWKARDIARNGRVAVTVPVRRGGLLALVTPIPPATISFHGTARVFPAGSELGRAAAERLRSLLPAERRGTAAIVEIVPEGRFLTYGVGVPLMKMRDPAASIAHVPVR
jgi:hypothetical protein